MALVEADNLFKSFGAATALDGLSFSVEAGEIFGLVGPDGAGKTTCLRILCGLMSPTSGRATVLGKDAAREPDTIKSQVGYMAQPARLYEDLTIEENIAFYSDLYEVPRDRYQERMNRLLEFSGLAPFRGRLFRNLSGGMKQKAGLSCSLIHTPKVLFLDEPTNGVDPVSRRDFWKILYELRREKVTIVVASTYLDEADRCHRVAFLDKGKAHMVMEPLGVRKLLEAPLFNLKSKDRRKALGHLKALEGVRNPYVFGTGIHFFLTDPAHVPALKTSLASEGLREVVIESIQPTLEDVYLSLFEEKGREA
jgi:ABC-2 type transport system ATP-binding protein